MYEEVNYCSDGLKIAAYLYKPKDWKAGDSPRPAVICLHGYTGMKEIYGLDVPRELCEAGYFALAPDHRGFGKSEGVRGRHRPLEQAQDVHDGITFLQTVEGVDPERIGLYGTSYGGANAIWVAAFDGRVKAVVSSVGVHDGERWLRNGRRRYEWYEFRDRIQEAARRRVRTGERTMIPATEMYPRDPHTAGISQAHHQKHPLYVKEYDLESAETNLRYKPEWVVSRIAPRPVLFIYAERDSVVPVEEALECYKTCGEPKKIVMLPKANHYDSYYFVNPEMHAIGAREMLDWFGKYL